MLPSRGTALIQVRRTQHERRVDDLSCETQPDAHTAPPNPDGQHEPARAASIILASTPTTAIRDGSPSLSDRRGTRLAGVLRWPASRRVSPRTCSRPREHGTRAERAINPGPRKAPVRRHRKLVTDTAVVGWQVA